LKNWLGKNKCKGKCDGTATAPAAIAPDSWTPPVAGGAQLIFNKYGTTLNMLYKLF